MKKQSTVVISKGMVFMPRLVIASSFLATMSICQANANELELSISEELIDLRFTSGYEQDFAGQLALMHADFNDLAADQISYRFFTSDSDSGLQLGAKAFWLDVEKDGGFGIGLSMGANRSLSDKMDLGFQLHYAPDIITGGDFDNVMEYDFRLNYQMVENGSFFVGYRNIEADNGSVDLEIYDDPYFGLKFEF